MDNSQALDAFMARVRALRTIGADAARAAAPLVERVVREAVSAGIDPDGKPWTATKTGARPLAHAANAISARVTGGILEIVLSGYYVFHNYGTKRDPQRRILPDAGAGIPPKIAEALRRAAGNAFARTMGGGR